MSGTHFARHRCEIITVPYGIFRFWRPTTGFAKKRGKIIHIGSEIHRFFGHKAKIGEMVPCVAIYASTFLAFAARPVNHFKCPKGCNGINYSNFPKCVPSRKIFERLEVFNTYNL